MGIVEGKWEERRKGSVNGCVRMGNRVENGKRGEENGEERRNLEGRVGRK